jgi:hypothetical protein
VPGDLAGWATRLQVHRPGPFEPVVACQAPSTGQLAMHMQQSLGTSPFVQIVDILGNQKQFSRPFGVEPGQCLMSRVRLDFVQPLSPGVIEFVNERGIAQICLWCANILDPMPLPKSIGPAERRKSALGADPSSGQYDDVAKRAHAPSLRASFNVRHGWKAVIRRVIEVSHDFW